MRRWIVGSVLAAATVAAVALTGAVAQAAEARDYVALGDSYASGLGAAPYRAGGCSQSIGNSYPAQWVTKKGRAAFGDTIVNATCSGATVADVRSKQLAALDKNTGWVTVTVGGNDVGFAQTLGLCILSDANCAAAVQAGVKTATETLPGRLNALFSDIRSKAPNAKVYVVGYPRLLTTAAMAEGCLFNADRRARLNHGADVLAEVLRNQTVRRNGFTYVDGRDIFAGHESCGGDPWIRGMNAGSEAFHPNAEGYERYARRLRQITG